MIFEIARIEVLEGTGPDFEHAVEQALALFKRVRGCGGASLHKVVEQPLEYTLVVRWDSVEDHMVHFRQSPDFLEWRGLVGKYFAKPPQVCHVRTVVGAL